MPTVVFEEEVDNIFVLRDRNGESKRLHTLRSAWESTCNGRETAWLCFGGEGRRSDVERRNNAYDEVALECGNVKGSSSFVVLLSSL